MQQSFMLRDLDHESLSRLIDQTSLIATTLVAREDGPEKPYADLFKINLSNEGQVIQDYVNQPLYLRQRVSYQKNFLESYFPNHTYYLPASAREQLHYLGCTSDTSRPAGTFAKDIFNRLLIDLSWASSQLEGNTYSRLDTGKLIAYGQAAKGKHHSETQMILNHKEAIEYLVYSDQDIGLNKKTIVDLHTLLSEMLLQSPAQCGVVRSFDVAIRGSVYAPQSMKFILEELLEQVLKTAIAIADPFEQSFFLMTHLSYLQPFGDVNKRVSRLAANIPLIQHNLSPLSFVDVPEKNYIEGLLGVYELNRTELLRDVYVWAYIRSCKQYVAVKNTLVAYDPFEFKYQRVLRKVVHNLIVNGDGVTAENITKYIPGTVSSQDIENFVAITMRAIETLHEHNAVRFRITPSELKRWREQTALFESSSTYD